MSDDKKLEIYKMFVDSASKVSEARSKVNAFFVALNGLIIGSNAMEMIAALFVFGIVCNGLWVQSIKSYKCLNDAKFKVILGMEKEMPFQCFTAEQQICTGEKRKNFTAIEQYIPYAMIGMYVVMLFCKYWDWLVGVICWCS